MDAPSEGGIGGTYGGNPLACVSALEVMKLFDQGSILGNAAMVESTLRARLDSWKSRFECVGDVRGLGPMRAVEFVKSRDSKEPWKEAVQKVQKHAYENGVICLSAGTFGNVLRFLVPLVITEAQLKEGLDVLESGISTL
jgi:4-aminobutyrate aminotransferase/(S)-3-amino-2-methylpropionate transaminase